MKKNLILILALLISGYSFAQNLTKIIPKIVVIGIGEKNPHFDESQFPDLNFYYTPTINIDYGDEEMVAAAIKKATNPFYKPQPEIWTGTPEWILKVQYNRGAESAFLLFDGEGTCYTIGYNLVKDIAGAQCANKKKLADNLNDVVKKGKTAKAAKKPYSVDKPHSLIGNKVENFPIQNLDGENIELADLLGDGATLVVLFYLPLSIDFRPLLTQEEMKALGKKEAKKANFKANLIQQMGKDATEILRDLETQFYKMKFKR
jgi:hypothetical protein